MWRSSCRFPTTLIGETSPFPPTFNGRGDDVHDVHDDDDEYEDD